MSGVEKQRLIATLLTEPSRSRKYLEAIQEASLHTIAEAIKECVLKPSRLLVNRRRFEVLLDHLVLVVTRPVEIELGGKASTEAKPSTPPKKKK